MDEINDRVADAAVAAVVTTDYLRRSAVVLNTTTDDTSRRAADEAPLDRFSQWVPSVHKSATPQSQRMEHSA
ncbi:DUF6192 family protein [Streptomyces caeruleatus]|uniref:Uncharacterized protein n=1 Tax=Streptomyces caeruleatus TaxID=661399 RepID=A0A101TS13_9ACTN|nr:DUF6192 family protein [Streptomyces caeruleatus]KUN97401.1 hypothetical protein AQJ67_31260 [Streptomyces caeruleatus]